MTVSSPILAHEVEALIASVEGVPGVTRFINWLEIHDKPGNHPSPQGGIAQTRARGELFQANWAPAFRALDGAIGSGLMLNCLAQRSILSAALGTIGFGLVLRAATNTNFPELIDEALTQFPGEGKPELWMAAPAGPML